MLAAAAAAGVRVGLGGECEVVMGGGLRSGLRTPLALGGAVGRKAGAEWGVAGRVRAIVLLLLFLSWVGRWMWERFDRRIAMLGVGKVLVLVCLVGWCVCVCGG